MVCRTRGGKVWVAIGESFFPFAAAATAAKKKLSFRVQGYLLSIVRQINSALNRENASITTSEASKVVPASKACSYSPVT
jgi:hypothetical protein